MRTVIVEPEWDRWGYAAPWGAVPYGLVCVATYLNANGQSCEILDMNADDISWDELPVILREKTPTSSVLAAPVLLSSPTH